ncbi:MAG: FAD binding domain-containing protein [Coprococcus sp.]
MFTIREYAMPESLEEAYTILKSRKGNQILGGCAWLRLGKKRINIAVDLSRCGLDYIREDEERIEIGAMTSYRSVETSDILHGYFNGVIADSVSSIIGTQFRNTVTVGGSVYGRFGFSDFLTPLLALDTTVVLYKKGSVPLEDFMNMPYEKDIIEKIVIAKDGRKASYQMFRNSRADFPVLNLAVSKAADGSFRVTVGARGPKAVRAERTAAYLTEQLASENGNMDEMIKEAGRILVNEVKFTDNMRASAEYRKILSGVLLGKAVREVEAC